MMKKIGRQEAQVLAYAHMRKMQVVRNGFDEQVPNCLYAYNNRLSGGN